jgi:hypothetical protein
MRYVCGGRLFNTLEEAIQYANFIHKVSRLIISITEEV